MKRIDTAAVIAQADRFHDLQRKRRDLRELLKETEDEMRKIYPALVKVDQGRDFLYPSADGWMKVCEIEQVEAIPDVPKMQDMLLKLRRKIPMVSKLSVVIRYQTDDELEAPEVDAAAVQE